MSGIEGCPCWFLIEIHQYLSNRQPVPLTSALPRTVLYPKAFQLQRLRRISINTTGCQARAGISVTTAKCLGQISDVNSIDLIILTVRPIASDPAREMLTWTIRFTDLPRFANFLEVCTSALLHDMMECLRHRRLLIRLGIEGNFLICFYGLFYLVC